MTGNTPAATSFSASSGPSLRGNPIFHAVPTFSLPSEIIFSPQSGDQISVYNQVGNPSSLDTTYTLYYYDNVAGGQGGWVPATPQISPVYRSVFVGKLTRGVIEGNVYRGATCSASAKVPNWVVQAVGAPGTFYGITGANGHYAILVPPGNYTVSSCSPPLLWTELLCSGAPHILNGVAAATFYTGNNFWENSALNGKDLAVDLVSYLPLPLRTPCCNQNMTYVISYRNAGSLALGGLTLTLTYPADQIWQSELLGAATLTSSSCGGATCTRTYALPNMVPLNSGHIKVTVKLPATPCSGAISAVASCPVAGDITPLDNSSTLPQQITCSHDPNDLLVTPAGCGPEGYVPVGQRLTYLIRFQNTGSGPAYQVVVSNKLDAHLDVSTLQVVGSSHPNVLTVQGQQLVWTFPNIYLPAQSDDDLGSQGYIKYQVSPLGSAVAGNIITNQAAICFDLNNPVPTVITTNTLTASPVPVAAFTVTPQVGSSGHVNDFTYTGGTAGATYLWSFGSDATPTTSTSQNPTGVTFGSDGNKIVMLQVSLGGCTSDSAVQVIAAGVPVLRAWLDNGQLVLSWSGNGYHLQERGDLKPATAWSATSGTLTQAGAEFTVALPLSGAEKYFRLSQVPP